MNDTLVKKRDSFQLPVYIVAGENWEAEVQLKEKDLVISGEDIILDIDDDGNNPDDLVYFYDFISAEAGTRALEMLNDPKESDNILIYEDDEEPEVGSTLFVFLKDEDPEIAGTFIPSFICYGNAGLYKNALDTFLLYKNEVKEYEKEQLKKEKSNKKKKENKKKK